MAVAAKHTGPQPPPPVIRAVKRAVPASLPPLVAAAPGAIPSSDMQTRDICPLVAVVWGPRCAPPWAPRCAPMLHPRMQPWPLALVPTLTRRLCSPRREESPSRRRSLATQTSPPSGGSQRQLDGGLAEESGRIAGGAGQAGTWLAEFHARRHRGGCLPASLFWLACLRSLHASLPFPAG